MMIQKTSQGYVTVYVRYSTGAKKLLSMAMKSFQDRVILHSDNIPDLMIQLGREIERDHKDHPELDKINHVV